NSLIIYPLHPIPITNNVDGNELLPLIQRRQQIIEIRELQGVGVIENPFGLIIVLNSNGNAEGDLFYDDGESIDTIGSKTYFFATYKWSMNDRQLFINVIENNYGHMVNLTLNSLMIYGLDRIPITTNVDGNELLPLIQRRQQIIEIRELQDNISDGGG
ncbi:unnamed protein product, partial [Rotaria sordida]